MWSNFQMTYFSKPIVFNYAVSKLMRIYNPKVKKENVSANQTSKGGNVISYNHCVDTTMRMRHDTRVIRNEPQIYIAVLYTI